MEINDECLVCSEKSNLLIFNRFLPQSTDVKDQHKTKGKRLKINKLKVPF